MGCLIRSVVSFVLIAVIAVFAFLNRDRIASAWHDLRGGEEPVLPSPELAAAADRKLDDLKDGRQTSVALTELELQSLLLFKYRELLPAFIDAPKIELNNDKIEITGRVPVDRLPSVSEIGEAATFLPDTTEIAVVGELLPLNGRRAALAVDKVSAARIPLPQRLIPGALRRLGRKDEPGLPKDALAIPLPPGADAAYVRGDSLVFVANGRN
ncbi:MAG: hypothetical protein ACT4O1_07655 [Gemmatimonadota bacterium]